MIIQGLDLTIRKGSTFYRLFAFKTKTGAAVNLTGYNARMQVRETVESGTKILDLSSVGVSPAITIDHALGLIKVSLTPAITAALDFETAVFDMEIYTTGDAIVERILEGLVYLSKEVTR